MTLTINVLQSHIDRGVKEDELNCPIALALRGTMEFRDRYRQFSVCGGAVWVGGAVLCRLPIEATNFIYNFDTGQYTHPFSFKIEVNP